MSDYPNLRALAEQTIADLGNPNVALIDEEPRHLAAARALLAALDADDCLDMTAGKFDARARLIDLDEEVRP